jgi:hypothetical protein
VSAAAQAGTAPLEGGLPERAAVHWRPRACERTLGRTGRWWTMTTVAHAVPFIVAAIALGVLEPVTIPVALALLAHAWWIPELYANRGAGVLRPRGRVGAGAGVSAEHRALLLLGDLIDEHARELHRQTGLVLQSGRLGVWIIGEAGAVLVARGGRRVYCYCVKATGADLPACDRIAHLLLALRCDERDFATVANLAFSGAPWRLARRLRAHQRGALRAARDAARRMSASPLTADGQWGNA